MITKAFYSEKNLELFKLYKRITRIISSEHYKVEETYDDGQHIFTLFTESNINYVFRFVLEETYHEGKAISKFLNLEKVSHYITRDGQLSETVEYEDYSHNDDYSNEILTIKNLLSIAMEACKSWEGLW